MRKLLNYKQVSEITQTPVSTLYALVSEGRIPYVRIGNRFIRFDLDDIIRWIDSKKSNNLSHDTSAENLEEV